jgi:hypothetical protein
MVRFIVRKGRNGARFLRLMSGKTTILVIPIPPDGGRGPSTATFTPAALAVGSDVTLHLSFTAFNNAKSRRSS